MASSELEVVFASLRSILEKHSDGLSSSDDSAKRYCLEGRTGPATLRSWGGKMKKTTIPVAWVEIQKAYVSYHLMGAYSDPKACIGVSKELQARKQGKACFNFKTADPRLLKELEALTERACRAFKTAGFIE